MRARYTPQPVALAESRAEVARPSTSYLSVRQIAEELAISHDTALRLFRDHPEAVYISPDLANRKRLILRIPCSAFEDFINSRKRANCRSLPDRVAHEKTCARETER